MKKVFIDSDVIISSLISSTGAAYLLLHGSFDLELFISNLSQEELLEVAKKLDIDLNKLKKLIEKNFKVLKIKETVSQLKKKYGTYVIDPDDAHIVAGAKKSKARFLISYNTKHFISEKIKQDLGFVVTTPAHLLQYLRSQ